jgi:hypothetical protein
MSELTLEIDARTGRTFRLLDAEGRQITNVKSLSTLWTWMGLEEVVITLAAPISVRYVERSTEEA